MRLLVAHPSPDVYGSDLQLVETVRAATEAGWDTTVVLPADGPLVPLLGEAGATVDVEEFPVLRKAVMSPRGLIALLGSLPASVWRIVRRVRDLRPDTVLVNTVTIPWWILTARLTGRRVVCHVHEAEDDQPRLVRLLLISPLLAAQAVVANSGAARHTLMASTPGLRRRTTVVYNGIPDPPAVTPPEKRGRNDLLRIVLVGRLSPRKGTDVALEAVALVRASGVDADLTVLGSIFPGYEWFEAQLRQRASRDDLAGHVHLLGYVPEPWRQVSDADLVVVPSRVEPFGNVAVEALLAERPLVASATQGLREIVRDGDNGLSVPPDDPAALADAIVRIAQDPSAARALAERGRADALARFSTARYREEMRRLLAG